MLRVCTFAILRAFPSKQKILMIEIRPVWQVTEPLDKAESDAISEMLNIEQKILSSSTNCFELVHLLMDTNVDELRSLKGSSVNDLVAGCEMARTGYLKQAYSLWRAWFEQTIFMLYFLEAPLHRSAWKVSSEVTQNDNPQYRLMLHQLLSESSEKHPFALVYDARFSALLGALKISNIPKAQRPIAKATRVLTVLSQGVHGTYQPHAAKDIASLNKQLDSHCLPILHSASEVINTFWILLLTHLISFPEEVLIGLRNETISEADLVNSGLENVQHIAALAPIFAESFPPAKHG